MYQYNFNPLALCKLGNRLPNLSLAVDAVKKIRRTCTSDIIPAVHSRPTITDVAKLCGVTPATVSRVLNNKQKFSTSQAVREKIHAVARKLGYVPDLSARNLNRQSTHIIGIFASPETHLSEGIYESLLEGIRQVVDDSEYDVFLDLSGSRDHAVPFWRFDGAILLQSPRAEIVKELDRRRVPYVCVNEKVGTPAAQVVADDAMGMEFAVEHLHRLGHRRIAYANARATYLTHYSVTERYETLIQAVRERRMELARGHEAPFSDGIPFLEQSVIGGKATAVITYDHHIATMIVGAAHAMKLAVPGDVSLICFNDVFPVALLPPPLTAVSVSGHEMGRIGAEHLLSVLMSEEREAQTREIRVPQSLVVRASTAAPAGHPP
jgi:LacI family transcriptional regulator